MTPENMATVHRACFTIPRPWTGAEFRALLDSPHIYVCTAAHGFAMGRAVAGEAEVSRGRSTETAPPLRTGRTER